MLEVSTVLRRIDRETVEILRKKVEAALKEVAEMYGLAVVVRGGRYGENEYLPKIEFKVKETAAGKSVAEAEFTARASILRIATQYGEVVTMRDETWRAVEINLRKSKFPVICERVRDGRRYCFPSAAFKRTT
jgi:predicted metal-dependent phosphotriesterase family hydrolase